MSSDSFAQTKKVASIKTVSEPKKRGSTVLVDGSAMQQVQEALRRAAAGAAQSPPQPGTSGPNAPPMGGPNAVPGGVSVPPLVPYLPAGLMAKPAAAPSPPAVAVPPMQGLGQPPPMANNGMAPLPPMVSPSYGSPMAGGSPPVAAFPMGQPPPPVGAPSMVGSPGPGAGSGGPQDELGRTAKITPEMQAAVAAQLARAAVAMPKASGPSPVGSPAGAGAPPVPPPVAQPGLQPSPGYPAPQPPSPVFSPAGPGYPVPQPPPAQGYPAQGYPAQGYPAPQPAAAQGYPGLPPGQGQGYSAPQPPAAQGYPGLPPGQGQGYPIPPPVAFAGGSPGGGAGLGQQGAKAWTPQSDPASTSGGDRPQPPPTAYAMPAIGQAPPQYSAGQQAGQGAPVYGQPPPYVVQRGDASGGNPQLPSIGQQPGTFGSASIGHPSSLPIADQYEKGRNSSEPRREVRLDEPRAKGGPRLFKLVGGGFLALIVVVGVIALLSQIPSANRPVGADTDRDDPELHAETPYAAQPRHRVKFTCTPSCDKITCDARRMTSISEARLLPGTHRCTASLPGYIPDSRVFEVPGAAAEQVFWLEQAAPQPSTP